MANILNSLREKINYSVNFKKSILETQRVGDNKG